MLTTTTTSTPQRASNIHMGTRGYLSILFRLVAMDFYKMRRRLLTIALLLAGVGLFVLLYGALGIRTASDVSKPASSFTPVSCTSRKIDGCANHPLSQAELEQLKQSRIKSEAQSMALPTMLNRQTQLEATFMGILMIIFVGMLVGEEYDLGTVRLMFTRGPTRLQYLFAKLIVALLYILIGYLLIFVISITLANIISPLASGIPLDVSFLTAGWLGHALLFILEGMLTWLALACIATFTGTLGRSKVVGIVAPIIWIFMGESLVANLIASLAGPAASTDSPLTSFIKAIPDYLLSNNLNALMSNQAHILFNADPGQVNDTHALLIVLGYMLISIALSAWLTMRRDVTH